MAKVDKDVFGDLCVAVGLPRPTPEYQFAKDIGRKWRMDWAWPDRKVYLECDGGVWTRGRHTRGAGYIKDAEKANEAACRGWRKVTVTPKEMKDGSVFSLLERILR